jgi:ribosomal protein S18 acetylase RimI-like enzyme
MNAFELTVHDLGELALRPLTADAGEKLGPALAAIPPWSVIGWPAERMTLALKRQLPSVKRFEVLSGGFCAGIIVIQDPFLHGPYLQLLAVLPGFQGRKLGLRLLQWMEAQARRAETRQLWVCVSTFNTRAKAFYERFGFEPVSILDKLASEASDELLMRKRLSYGASAR